jgi:hypothetical protein
MQSLFLKTPVEGCDSILEKYYNNANKSLIRGINLMNSADGDGKLVSPFMGDYR